MNNNSSVPPPEIDSTRIFNAILASGVTNPKAVQAGSELVDAWTEQCWVADQRYRTLGLEVGWFIEVDERTFVVGAVDKLAVEKAWRCANCDGACNCGDPVEYRIADPFVFERKTTSSSKTWTAERWFEDLRAGSQVATYALALQRGTFIFAPTPTTPFATPEFQKSVRDREKWFFAGGGFDKDGNAEVAEWTPAVTAPRILARGITKSKPPQIWPTPEGAWLDLSHQRLNAQWNAFRTEATALRARRQLGVVPWQTPGFQCKLHFGPTVRPCSAWSVCHDTLEFPAGGVPLRGLSPGSESVVKHLVETGRISLDRADDYIVLSASSFKSAQQCPELWRQESIGATREADNEAMDTGTVLHAGCAEFDRILQENGY